MTTVDSAVEPAERLAAHLADVLRQGGGCALTWLNHYSALQSMRAGVRLEEFDYVGIDGIFLGRLLNFPVPRTSADLMLPALLRALAPTRISLVGSTPDVLSSVRRKLETEFGHSVVLQRDGFDSLPHPATLRRQLRLADAQLVIVALGSPLQDEYVLALRQPGMVIATCGGWFDQFVHEGYYPSWAYATRLNWLVRLVREPRRLWRRYTVHAAQALFARSEMTAYVMGDGAKPLAKMREATRP